MNPDSPKPAALFILALGIIITSCNPGGSGKTPPFKGPWLGQQPPGMIPAIFAPALASPEDHKHSAPAFSPDGRELFFSVYLNDEDPQKIMYLRLERGRWTPPDVAPFSGTYQDGNPVFSTDGQRLYFGSRRPDIAGKPEVPNLRIWVVNRAPNGWGTPVRLSVGADTLMPWVPRSAVNDSLLLISNYSEPRDADIYSLTITDGSVKDLQLLPEPISLPGIIDGGATADPGQTFLIFSSFNRQGRRRLQLYVSFRTEGGEWGTPRSMGDMINQRSARFPLLSPDLQYLFFTSVRSGNEEMYWVHSSVVDFLRHNRLDLIDVLAATLLEQGLEPALTQYDELVHTHARVYRFDLSLFEGVGDRLIAVDRLAEAAEFIQIGLDRFRQPVPVSLALLLDLLRDDADLFRNHTDQLRERVGELDLAFEAELNTLGYRLLGYGQGELALQIFTLNTELFPRSANTWDSLGEAFLETGDRENAIRSYRKALQLDPQSTSAQRALETLLPE